MRRVGGGTVHSEADGSQQEQVFAESTEPPACSYTGNSERRSEPECNKNKQTFSSTQNLCLIALNDFKNHNPEELN